MALSVAATVEVLSDVILVLDSLVALISGSTVVRLVTGEAVVTLM